MVPKQVWYGFPGIDYCIVSIQRGKVPIPRCTWSLSGVCGWGFIVVFFTEAALDGYLDQLLIRQVAVHRVVLKAQRWTTGGSWRREASCLHDSADEERITTQ